MINRSNYEIYFLDYHENRLTKAEADAVLQFIEANADLKDEFNAFENVSLENLEIEYPGKNLLKKTEITSENIQHFLIAEFEGDLNAEEKTALREFLNLHPQFEKDRALFSKTKLQPAVEAFEMKASLKKEAAIVSDENINEFLIREIENDLNAVEVAALNAFIAANPAYANDRKLFTATVLNPEAVIYPHKGELKKTVAMFSNPTIRYAMGIAAMLIMIAGIYWSNFRNQKTGMIAGNEVVPANDTVIQKQSKEDSSQAGTEKIKRNDYILPTTKSPQKNLFAAKNQKRAEQKNQNDAEQKIKSQQQDAENKVDLAKNNMPVENENKPVQQEIELAQNNPVISPTSNTNDALAMNANQELSVSETLNKLAKQKIDNLTGNDNFSKNDPTITRKKKLLDTAAWAINKVGGKKVKMQNQYTTSNDLMNTQITAGAFSIEHVSGE